MNPLSLLLLPFSIIYALITALRNWLYDKNFLKSYKPQIPVISVGNLSVGGTGKTPHCEFLIQLLSEHGYQVAYLSRGYKRKTKGFRWVTHNATALEVGDEAIQVASKFPKIHVAVCENRLKGIENIIKEFPETHAIVLDDAFQYRRIEPTINVLLTEMTRLYSHDFVLPAGRLRECKSGAKRADIIIVTKTHTVLPILLKKYIYTELSPLYHQQIFFTYYIYSEFIPIGKRTTSCRINSLNHIFLLTGIENHIPLVEYLSQKGYTVHVKAYPDHHFFTTFEIAKFIEDYQAFPGKKKIILTTEKDLARLDEEHKETLTEYPFYKISVKIGFHEEKQSVFENLILDKLRDTSTKKIKSF